MGANGYAYALSITSQFYYCGLPLRLDSYSKCGFRCLYCFSHARGGNRPDGAAQRTSAESVRRALDQATRQNGKSAVAEMLARRQPIHFGGMSDPFPPVERTARVTQRILEVLAEYRHPTIISTKSDLFASDEYLEVLTRGRFLVQVSLSSLDDTLVRSVDVGTPGPARLLDALRVASRAGIPTAARIQPLLPSRENDALEVMEAMRSVGVAHVAAEHLKSPLERAWAGTPQLESALRHSFQESFRHGGKRVGREWVLPVEDRLDRILELRERAHLLGMSFGAADNDLLLLSDGGCCCSGADLIKGFNNYFDCTYTQAVRKGITGDIAIRSIEREWRPSASIARFVNSRSRLPSANGRGASVWDYLKANWNGRLNGNSPASLHGVRHTGHFDEQGFAIYRATQELRALCPIVDLRTTAAWNGGDPASPNSPETRDPRSQGSEQWT